MLNLGSGHFGVLLSRFSFLFWGVISTFRILPHEKEIKSGQNSPQNRRILRYARGLINALSFLLIFGAQKICAEGDLEREARRIHAHLLIHDYSSAVREGQEAIKRHPDSFLVHIAYLKALSEQGDEIEAMKEWERGATLCTSEKERRHCLETLAWGVLCKGTTSSQLTTRLSALIGATLTKDVKAIPILLEQLKSSNAILRSLAVRLAASYPDAPIKEEIIRLMRQEKVWSVRLEVIQAAGFLRILELKEDLKEMISNPKSLIEEKELAIVSLVGMYEAIDRESLLCLVHSDRSGLRELAAELIAHLSLHQNADLLLPLLKDTSSDVKVATLNAIALLRIRQINGIDVQELIDEHLHSNSPEVAITAAYLLLLLEENRGHFYLAAWLKSDGDKWRRMASAAVRASGGYGVRLGFETIRTTNDPYVKINLAMGLIGQRVQVKLACQAIHDVLVHDKKTLWMWDHSSNPLFSSLAPSSVRHIEQIPHYPAVVDQLTQLDLLFALSIVRYPKSQEAVKNFLGHNSWGVTGTAAATLLREGDEEGLFAVRQLIEDPDEKIRVQAALILGIVGSDPSAVQVLQDAYSRVNREMKIHILEALSHIGDPRSIPFLLERLKEPFQVLRVVAASALIQCLYH